MKAAITAIPFALAFACTAAIASPNTTLIREYAKLEAAKSIYKEKSGTILERKDNCTNENYKCWIKVFTYAAANNNRYAIAIKAFEESIPPGTTMNGKFDAQLDEKKEDLALAKKNHAKTTNPHMKRATHVIILRLNREINLLEAASVENNSGFESLKDVRVQAEADAIVLTELKEHLSFKAKIMPEVLRSEISNKFVSGYSGISSFVDPEAFFAEDKGVDSNIAEKDHD